MDNTIESLKENINSTDNNDKLDKLKKSYLMLKQKVCRSHELIKLYNDKLKECDRLKIDLDLAHKEAKKMTNNYNGTLAKVIKLELQNAEYKKKIQSLSNTIVTHETKIAGDQQHLQQLTCKLKELEEKHMSERLQIDMEKTLLQDKVKELERQMKITNKANNSTKKEKINRKQQGIEKGTYCCLKNAISRIDVAVNTINDNADVKSNTRTEKDVMTDMTFKADKDQLYPLFCDNCEQLLGDPVKKICKTMSIDSEIIPKLSSPVRSQSMVSLSIFSPEKDEDSRTSNKKRLDVQNSLEDNNIQDDGRNLTSVPSSSEVFKTLSSPSQDSYTEREEPSSNSPKNSSFSSKFNESTDLIENSCAIKENNNDPTSSNNLMHNLERLKRKMKKLERKVERQSRRRKKFDANYFQRSSPPYPNYYTNEMLNHNFSLNVLSTLLNGMKDIVNRSANKRVKPQKRKYETKACKFSSKKIKLKRRARKNSSSVRDNNAWNVDSILLSYDDERNKRNCDLTSNERIVGLSASTNEDLTLDDDTTSDTNVKKDSVVVTRRKIACEDLLNSIKETNLSSSTDNEDRFVTTVPIDKKPPIIDTAIVETFDRKINDSFKSSTSGKNISTSKSDLFDEDIEKRTRSITIAKEFKDDNECKVKEDTLTTRMIDNDVQRPSVGTLNSTNEEKEEDDDGAFNSFDITNSLGGVVANISNASTVSIASTSSNVTSPVAANSLVVKNRKRKLQSIEKESKPRFNSIKDSSIVSVKNDDYIVRESNGTSSVIENTKNNNNSIEESTNERSDERATNNACFIPQKKQRVVRLTKTNDRVETSSALFDDDTNDAAVDRETNVESVKTNLVGNISDRGITSTDEDGGTIDSTKNRNDDNLNVRKRDVLTKTTNNLVSSNRLLFSNVTRFRLTGLKNVRSRSLNNLDLLLDSIEPRIDNNGITVNERSPTRARDYDKSNETRCNDDDDDDDDSKEKTLGESKRMVENWTKDTSDDDSFKPENERINNSPNEFEDNILSDDGSTRMSINANKSNDDEVATKKLEDFEPTMPDKNLTINESSLKRNKMNADVTDKIIKDASLDSSVFALISPLKDDDGAFNNDDTSERFTRMEINVSNRDTTTFPRRPELYSTRELDRLTMMRSKRSTLAQESERIFNVDEDPTMITVDEDTNDKDDNNLKSKFVDKNLGRFDGVFREEEMILNNSVCVKSVEKRPTVSINVQEQSESMMMSANESDTSIDGINDSGELRLEISVDPKNATTLNDDLEKVAYDSNDETNARNINNVLNNPVALLEDHLKKNLRGRNSRQSKKILKMIEPFCVKIDNFINKQLYRITNDADWSMSVHKDVIDKLSSLCSVRIVAKGIVDFMLERKESNLDKSYTPPAPLMTMTQQKIVTLLVDLEIRLPTVIKWVQAGIEYKLFRLNNAPTLHQIQNLIRLYIVLTRIQKDREKARMLCCDALYCLGLHAIPVIYTVLTCWPEIFPQFTENVDILPKFIAHIIMSQQATNFSQLYALKNLLSTYYKYKAGSTITKDLVEESLKSLEVKSNSNVGVVGLKTAIILLAKKEGVTWSHSNIIQSRLLPNIINKKYLSIYEPFSLLGYLMRTFPVDDNGGIVKNIIEQLSDLIDSGEGSHDQQEGVVSALLCLSRHDIEKVVSSTMKWIPSERLRATTIDQYYAFFRQRPKTYWRNYLKKFNKVYVKNVRL